jgi:mRNA interferase MazF
MITSRLSSKAQTTVPKSVRGALGLSEGDNIVYEIVEGGVLMRRVQPVSADDPVLLFDEWAGDEDRKAYADLRARRRGSRAVPLRRPAHCQHRPALVVAAHGSAGGANLLWVLMITSARNRPWPDDVEIGTREPGSGLSAPSVVRTRKIATIDARHAEPIGRIGIPPMDRVRANVAAYLGL